MSISIRTIATLVFAAFLGLVAVILARSYLNSSRSPLTRAGIAGAMVPVVVAAQPLERGAALQPSMLKIVNFPQDASPAGGFNNIGALTGAEGQQRLVLRSMVANEPILLANVSGPGGRLNLSTLIVPGMRAVSLRDNDVVGVGGFIVPGDRVDILLTRSEGNGNQTNQLTQILADSVRVLGVDQSDNDDTDKPVVAKAVTVEVTPEQAQAISLGETVGTVSLTLRHVADGASLAHTILTVADLGGTERRRAPSGGGAASASVRVIRGVDASRFSFTADSSVRQPSTLAATPERAGTTAP